MRFKSTDPLVRTVIDLGIPALIACVWFGILLSPPAGWDVFTWDALVLLTPLGVICVLLLTLFWWNIWAHRKRRKLLLEAEFEAPTADRVFQWRDLLRIAGTVVGVSVLLYALITPAWHVGLLLGIGAVFTILMVRGAMWHRRFRVRSGPESSSPARPDDDG